MPFRISRIQWNAIRPHTAFPELMKRSSYAYELDKHQIACKAAIEVANNNLVNVGYVDSDDDFTSGDDSVYGSNNRRRLYSEKDVSRFF